MSEPIDLLGSVALASPEHCATWTADARHLFQMGARHWGLVLERPVLALQSFFHHSHGADATVYVAAHMWTDRQGNPGTLVSLYFATDAAISKDALEAIGPALVGHGWSSDGIHPAPDYAFPCLGMRSGQIYYLWVDDPDDGPRCTVLGPKGARARPEIRSLRTADAARFPAGVAHARGVWDARDDAERQLRDQLKLAFAYQVAERVVHADGTVEDDELVFLKRTFPDDHLDGMWLHDPAMRQQLADQAERELRDRIGYHEKLGLLSTFFGACYADGNVSVQELRVLKEASEALGLDRSEVAGYLQKLW